MALIDVHHHLLPREYVDAVGAQNIARQGSSGWVPAWSVADSLARMEASGIDAAIASISAPGVGPVREPAKALQIARMCNDLAAEIVLAHPRRFGFFAILPLPDIDASLAELSYALDTLGADGVCLLSNYSGLYPGDVTFAPLLEELNRRGAIVFLHPDAPPAVPELSLLSQSMLEFPFDTTRAIASLLLSGALGRYPRIRFIAAHAGGAMPFLFRRLATLVGNNPALVKLFPDGIAGDLGRLYADTTLATSDGQLQSLADMVPRTNILFGTDYPFGPRAQMKDAAFAIDREWTNTALRDLLCENALRLFPRFAPVA